MSPLVVWYCTYCLYCQGWYWWVELDGKKHPLHSLETFDSCFWRWELLVKIWTVWWWWWWWWLMVFVVWLTDERRLALFPAGTIVRDPLHRESPTLGEQDVQWRSCAVGITATLRCLNLGFGFSGWHLIENLRIIKQWKSLLFIRGNNNTLFDILSQSRWYHILQIIFIIVSIGWCFEGRIGHCSKFCCYVTF